MEAYLPYENNDPKMSEPRGWWDMSGEFVDDGNCAQLVDLKALDENICGKRLYYKRQMKSNA
jgi:hypothetical protein